MIRYADDIVLIAKSNKELEEMVEELIRKSKEVGLTINTSKTKILGRGEKKNNNIEGATIVEVDEIQYVGQTVSFKNRREKEIQKGIKKCWASFWGLKTIYIEEN